MEKNQLIKLNYPSYEIVFVVTVKLGYKNTLL